MTPHQRIMLAASKGVGMRLSADEVWELSQDGAIATCADNDDAKDEKDRDPARTASAKGGPDGR